MFRPAASPGERRARPPIADRPHDAERRWILGEVTKAMVLAESAGTVITVDHILAYPTGLAFALTVLTDTSTEPRRHPQPWWPDLPAEWQADLRAGRLPDGLLRFGVLLADGTVATERFSGVLASDAGAVLVSYGGGGGGGDSGPYTMTADLWLTPIPSGPVTFVCEWPARDIGLSRRRIGEALVRRAVARASLVDEHASRRPRQVRRGPSDFFEPEPDARRRRSGRPVYDAERMYWDAFPGRWLGAPLARRLVLWEGDDVSIVASEFVAFPWGFRFSLRIHAPLDAASALRTVIFELPPPRAWVRAVNAGTLPDDMPRFGIRDAAGRQAHASIWQPLLRAPSEPASPVVEMVGGQMDEELTHVELRVMPLLEPPSAIVYEWPGRGIPASHALLPVGALRRAAKRTRRIWPPAPGRPAP